MGFEKPQISKEDEIFQNIRGKLSFGEERGVDWDIRPGKDFDVLSYLFANDGAIMLHI